ncbi:MAG: NADH-quinone oxidoreductase subunit NuoB [Ruminiclostridium sp.]|nr:NADH-quinone oxidoreductase subunit NuoB [Ruminiclostridium sp.]
MHNIIKKYLQHGIVTVEYPKKPVNTEFITGKPVVDDNICTKCGDCVERCPTSAISLNKKLGGIEPHSFFGDCSGNATKEKIGFNMDECIFCSLCADICPVQAIKMSHDFELAKKKREELRTKPLIIEDRKLPSQDYELLGSNLKEKINSCFGRSLGIREVDAGSCNGCDNEISAMNSPYNDLERFGMHFVASPRHADMLLVTGPAARNMELALIKTYNAAPEPKLVVAVGACACSGGIFKDSYSTRNGIDCILPVDVYIPGCPPRPQALIYGILKAIESIG